MSASDKSTSDRVRSVAPWDFTAPKGDGTDVPNVPTPEGEALGRELARLIALDLETTTRRFPGSLPPCDECAFVAGTMPNRSPATLMDAIKCVIECDPFYCHKGVNENNPAPKRLCAGWVAAVSTDSRASEALRRRPS